MEHAIQCKTWLRDTKAHEMHSWFFLLCIWTETLLLVVLNSLLAEQPEQWLPWLAMFV